MRTGIVILGVVALAGCAGRGAPTADGGTGGRDAGATDGAVACGTEVCAATELCCYDCDGVAVGCSMGCPGLACPPDDAGSGDAGTGACRSDADCASTEYCLHPGATPPCGVGCMVERTCESSADCAEGSICVEVLGACCASGDPSSSRCVPECTEGSCGDGFTCGTEGLCEPISCADGFACPEHTSCTGTGDAHGCQRDTCTADAECDAGGFCVGGLCYDALGECRLPSA